MAKTQRRSTRRSTKSRPARKTAARTRPRAGKQATKVTLERIAQRALEDRAFFRALDRDVEGALVRVNWRLDRRDVTRLKTCLRGKVGAPTSVVVKPKRVFQLLHRLPPRLQAELAVAWGVGWGTSPPHLRRRDT